MGDLKVLSDRGVLVNTSKMADELDSEQTEDFDSISHSEAMSLFRMNLAEITGDPLLVGLPSEPTLEEVNSQIALEHGRAIIVNVLQQDEDRTVLRELSLKILHVMSQ